MKSRFLLTYVAIFISHNIAFSQSINVKPVDYVNPLIGTFSDFSLSNGNTYPAIGLPFGMNYWTPQTAKNGDGW
ncbi:MAG TPA: hypothetical protein VK172_07045, partial [Lentimicrobium sp.]|nr:hypothetical protein [Lentimicrobium sp.]